MSGSPASPIDSLQEMAGFERSRRQHAEWGGVAVQCTVKGIVSIALISSNSEAVANIQWNLC
jgi:hypothetical protein